MPLKPTRILGIDPGKTTGVSVIDYYEDKTTEIVSYSQVDGERLVNEHAYRLETLKTLKKLKIDDMVIEDFIGGGPRTKYATMTLKIIGVWMMLASVVLAESHVRVPQARTAFIPQARVSLPKELNHSIDALAHCLSFCHRDLGGLKENA